VTNKDLGAQELLHILGNTLVLITSFLPEGVIAHTAPEQGVKRRGGRAEIKLWIDIMWRLGRQFFGYIGRRNTVLHSKEQLCTLNSRREPSSSVVKKSQHPHTQISPTSFFRLVSLSSLSRVSNYISSIHSSHSSPIRYSTIHASRCEDDSTPFSNSILLENKIHSASRISLASPATHTPSSTKIWLPVVPYVPEPTNPPFPPPINLRSNDPENLATLFKSPFFYHHPLVRISSSEEAGVTTTSIYPCRTRRDGYSTSKHRPV